MVGSEGVEPSTKRLRVSCSTTELQTHCPEADRDNAEESEGCKRIFSSRKTLAAGTSNYRIRIFDLEAACLKVIAEVQLAPADK